MSVTFGPTSWWVRSKEAADYYARICPVGTILPDGSAIFCRQGGRSWIVAPDRTQIGDQWASNRYPSTPIGTPQCCICDWPNVCNRLVLCGFNPCDWFIPCQDILVTALNCRSCWDICSSTVYWSSSESTATNASATQFSGEQSEPAKSGFNCVRAVRSIIC